MESVRGIDSASECEAMRIAIPAKIKPSSPPLRLKSKSFLNGVAKDRAGTGAKSEANRILVMIADRSYQHENCDVSTGNQENHRDRDQQYAKERSGLAGKDLAELLDIAVDVNLGHRRRKTAHDLPRNSIRILCSLRKRDAVF